MCQNHSCWDKGGGWFKNKVAWWREAKLYFFSCVIQKTQCKDDGQELLTHGIVCSNFHYRQWTLTLSSGRQAGKINWMNQFGEILVFSGFLFVCLTLQESLLTASRIFCHNVNLRIIESQDHRMIWVKRHLKDHQIPPTLTWAELPTARSNT